jgi:hypothetical protein
MNFFEDMGMLLRREFLDRDMIWGTFSWAEKRQRIPPSWARTAVIDCGEP